VKRVVDVMPLSPEHTCTAWRSRAAMIAAAGGSSY